MLNSMDLNWKSHPINLQAIEVEVKALVGSKYVGNSADTDLTLWFSEALTQEESDLIQAYWDGLDEASPEAVSYKTSEQLKAEADAEKVALRASSKAKLLVLGLSEAEANAVLGV
jgi:hypothetical protein